MRRRVNLDLDFKQEIDIFVFSFPVYAYSCFFLSFFLYMFVLTLSQPLSGIARVQLHPPTSKKNGHGEGAAVHRLYISGFY